jgi:cytoskeleton protein RodZ
MNDAAVIENEDEAGNDSLLTVMPGAYLSTLRNQAGLTQHEVADSLHLTVHYVNALENDEYQKLPGKIFVKGYLKSYAILMEESAANTQTLIQRFEEVSEERNDFPQDLITIQSRFKSHRSGMIWLVLAGLLIIGILAASWYFWSAQQSSAQQINNGLVPDYLQAADDNASEVVLSIPVGNQVYTVRDLGNSLPVKPASEAKPSEQVPEWDNSLHSEPEQGEEETQLQASPDATGSLEG